MGYLYNELCDHKKPPLVVNLKRLKLRAWSHAGCRIYTKIKWKRCKMLSVRPIVSQRKNEIYRFYLQQCICEMSYKSEKKDGETLTKTEQS